MRKVAWAVLLLVILLSWGFSCYWFEKYTQTRDRLEAMTAQAAADQERLQREQQEIAKGYEDRASSDNAAIASLRGELDRLRRAAKRVPAAGAGAAPSGGGGTGAEPDILGAFLEGADLASEGAELARREHTALTTCVEMYNRAAR